MLVSKQGSFESVLSLREHVVVLMRKIWFLNSDILSLMIIFFISLTSNLRGNQVLVMEGL